MEGRKGGWKEGSKGEWRALAGDPQEHTQDGSWNERGRRKKRGWCPSPYLDFFRCSSSGSCTERGEAGIDQEKTEGYPSPEPWQVPNGLQLSPCLGWGPRGESALPSSATY